MFKQEAKWIKGGRMIRAGGVGQGRKAEAQSVMELYDDMVKPERIRHAKAVVSAPHIAD